MKTYNVLIFPCGSEIALEIFHSLKYSPYFNLIGGSSVESNHGRMVFEKYISHIPFIYESNFLLKINEIIEQENIDFIFPAHDDAILFFSLNITQLNCKVISPDFKTVQICRSKKNTYQFFKNKVPLPKVFDYNEIVKLFQKKVDLFPLFIKPNIGQGSVDSHKIETLDQLHFFLNSFQDYVILEYLPGKEYTIDCLTDNDNKLIFVGARERIRIKNGISVDTKTVCDNRFNTFAESINSYLSLKGAWFFQLKENCNGELVLLEIGPRIAGSMALYRALGINFSIITLFIHLKKDVSIFFNKYEIRLDRALSTQFQIDLDYISVYIDLDDCLILKDKVNLTLICFLYQCVNKKIRIHLLSKHTLDIQKTLLKYRIDSIFDSIIQLNKNDNKSDYIMEFPSIFIDDSFKEREEVHEKLKIPVFGPDSVIALINDSTSIW